MMRFAKKFLRADGGAPAVEFALIAPVMLVMFLGISETANIVQAGRKVSNAASSAADLVAQTTTINDDQMADIMGALGVILRPFDASEAEIRISSIVADDEGETTVAWSDAHNMSPLPEGQAITLDPVSEGWNIVTANQGIIMAEVYFTYHGIDMSDKFYMKPRRSTTVQREE